MKVCFPVAEDEGFESKVYGHFGSAPMFIVVDTELKEVKALNNGDKGHGHGSCRPLKALGSEKVDAIVVGGIGSGALQGLNRAGLKVYQAQGPTISDNISFIAEEKLSEITSNEACSGHSHGHGHAHGCSH